MELSRELLPILRRGRPEAAALVRGVGEHKALSGAVYFFQSRRGVLVMADIQGLPHTPGACGGGVFGFHIHEGKSCTGSEDDPLADTGGHFNPGGCQHPEHAGDLPPLFENGGQAFMVFLTDRFKVSDVIGRTAVIHGHPDDFRSQPSGDSGMKIACGVIQRV